MRRKVVILVFLLTTLTSFAKIEIDLNTATEKVIEKSETIKKYELDLENSKLQKKEAFKSGLPSVGYSGTIAKTEDKNTFTGSDEYHQYKLTLSQPIFNGFRIITAIQNGDKYVQLSEYALEKEKNDEKLKITKNYIEALKLKKQIEILENSKKELEKNFEKIKRMYELGFVMKSDVLDINYGLIELESTILQMKNAFEISKLSIKNDLGIASDEKLILKDVKNIDKKINVINIDLGKDLIKIKNESLTAKILDINLDLAKASEKFEKANFLPMVNGQFSYGNQTTYGSIKDAFKSENLDWSVGISISGTLYNFGKNIDAYQRSKNNTKKVEYDRKFTKDNLEIALKSAYLDIVRLQKVLEAKEKALESATENYKYQEKRLNNNLIDSITFLKAENSLREANIGYNITKLDLYYAIENYKNLLK
ncbi:outer membrane protein TolC [Hypnocyclicus thermotrophus]|uniref:Outer membrane protein TolC n=1 Tax=Hypnocyclicus thermotrophus TaxID=1627895 RepID=A0AA46I5M0_9FUSO|nr:TolC family protein [Hypnocyclicus thermotrophus]TDT69886.1 outer membrane protein TolC [Hypnocyclicus thermotrophus]